MDLIDRSKLHSVYTIEGIDSEGVLTTRSYWAADVANAPTVEAIPIEWLKQWEEKHKDDPCYCGFVSEEIIKDWEKENETD